MKMTVEQLLSLMENGTLVSIWDNSNDMTVVEPTYWFPETQFVFEPYFTLEIICINTSSCDYDIEIVI